LRGDGTAAGDEPGEGGQLAADDADRAAVVAGEVDGEEDDQRDLDGLGDVRGAVVRALDRPHHDRGGRVAHQAEADEPAEPDGQRERDDDRDGGDQVAQRVQGEQQATERVVDVARGQGKGDDRGTDGDVGGAESGAGGEHRVVNLT